VGATDGRVIHNIEAGGLSTFLARIGHGGLRELRLAGMRRLSFPCRFSRRTVLACVAITLGCLTVVAAVVVLAAVVAAAPAVAAAPEGPPPATAKGTQRWGWPLSPAPVVLRPFTAPPRPWAAGHRGVDLAAGVGQAVHSAGAGVVTYAGLLAGRGVVSVTHGALRTTYEPVRATVRVGERVTLGQALGTLEARAGHCAPRPCLHWGLRRGDVYLDPLTLLRRGPSRLLPIWSPETALDRGTAASDPRAPEHLRQSHAAPRGPAATSGPAVATGAVGAALTLAAVRQRRTLLRSRGDSLDRPWSG
jgi:murein DD-endopeptidase MepM/ murein hydrolase activator NlpD